MTYMNIFQGKYNHNYKVGGGDEIYRDSNELSTFYAKIQPEE
jgi:hypothetical protein